MKQFAPGDRVMFIGMRAPRNNAADVVFASPPAWATVAEGEGIGPRVPVVYDSTPDTTYQVLVELLVGRWDAPVPDPRHEAVAHEPEGETVEDAYDRGRSDGWAAAVDTVRTALEVSAS